MSEIFPHFHKRTEFQRNGCNNSIRKSVFSAEPFMRGNREKPLLFLHYDKQNVRKNVFFPLFESNER